MKWIAPFAGMVAALALVALSLPWVFWAMGCAMTGAAERGDAVMERSPFWRYLDWLER